MSSLWPRRTPRPTTRYAGSMLRQQPARSRPWLWLVAGCGGAAILLVLAVGAVNMARSDLFRVDHVRVVGAKVVDAKAIEAAAHLDGRSLLGLDTSSAARRVAALPGIAGAHVHPDWPSGAVIDVSERQGWGYWQVGGGNPAVIDADGKVVDRARPPADNAPTIYQQNAAPLQPGDSVDRDTVTLVTRLLSDGTFMRLGLEPQRFDFDQSRGLVVHVVGGPAAVIGDSHDYEFKVAAWIAMNARIKADHIQATEIDLRFGKELVVR